VSARQSFSGGCGKTPLDDEGAGALGCIGHGVYGGHGAYVSILSKSASRRSKRSRQNAPYWSSQSTIGASASGWAR
jgi:hypothetical protein